MSLLIEEQLDETTAVAEPVQARWSPRQFYDPGFKAHVARELDLLRRLEAGWDGYRAARINPDIIDAARRFVFDLTDHVAPRPNIVPLASGGLQFEWTFGNIALELEFESPTTVRFLKWNPATGQPEENTIAVDDREHLETLVRWYTRQNV